MTDLVKEDCSPGAVEHVLQESECDKIGLVHDGEPVTRCRSAQGGGVVGTYRSRLQETTGRRIPLSLQ